MAKKIVIIEKNKKYRKCPGLRTLCHKNGYGEALK